MAESWDAVLTDNIICPPELLHHKNTYFTTPRAVTLVAMSRYETADNIHKYLELIIHETSSSPARSEGKEA